MLEDLLELWRTNEEINLYLLRHIPDEGFQACTLLKNGQPSKGRNVARIFRHMHEMRRHRVGREFLQASGILKTIIFLRAPNCWRRSHAAGRESSNG